MPSTREHDDDVAIIRSRTAYCLRVLFMRTAGCMLRNNNVCKLICTAVSVGMEHDEAVKMVNFSRSKKPAKCDLDMGSRESLVPDLWSPGSRSGVRYGDMFRICFN